ncbi:phospholipid-binding protein, partial [Acinetobacter baumannii]|nr:phospholipid-binding protein [Acinetobacter baumannii]
MRISVQGIREGQPIPEQFAFAVPHDTGHITFSDNRNPKTSWSEAPEGTRSFALLLV